MASSRAHVSPSSTSASSGIEGLPSNSAAASSHGAGHSHNQSAHAAEQRLQILSSQSSAMKAELRQVSRDAAALKSANDVLRSRLDNRTEAVEAAKAAATAAKDELSAARNQIASLEKKLELKAAEISAVRKELGQLPVALARLETLQEERAALIDFARDAKEEVQRLRNSDGEAAALRVRLAAAEERCKGVQGGLAAEQERGTQLQAQLQDSEEHVRSLKGQVEHAQHNDESVCALRAEMSELRAELDAANAAAADARALQLDEAAAANQSDAARAREERRWRRAEAELAAYRRLERALVDAAGLEGGRPLWQAVVRGGGGEATTPRLADGPTPTVIAQAVSAIAEGLKEAAVADAVAATSNDHEAALAEAHSIAEAATSELEQVQAALEHTNDQLRAAQAWRARMAQADAAVAAATGLRPAASSGEAASDAAAVATASGAGQHGRTCSACASGSASAAPHTCGCGPTSTVDILTESWWCTPPLPAAMPALALAMGAAARELATARRTARMSQCELADIKADMVALEAEGEVAAVAATRSTRDARTALRARDAELAEARKQVQTGQEALAAATCRENDLRSRVAALEASAETLGRSTGEWQAKLDAAQGHCETLRAQLSEARSQCDQLRTQLSEERDTTRRALKLAGQGPAASGGSSDSEDEYRASRHMYGDRPIEGGPHPEEGGSAGGRGASTQREGPPQWGQAGAIDPRAVTWHAAPSRHGSAEQPTVVYRSSLKPGPRDTTPSSSRRASSSTQTGGGSASRGSNEHASPHHAAPSGSSSSSRRHEGGGFWALSPPSPDRELSQSLSTLSASGRSAGATQNTPHGMQTRSGSRVVPSRRSQRGVPRGVQGGYTSSDASDSGYHVSVLPPQDIRQFVYDSAGKILGYVGRGEDAHSDGESHQSELPRRASHATSSSSVGWEGQLAGGGSASQRPPHHPTSELRARALSVSSLGTSDDSDDSDYVLPTKSRGARRKGRGRSRSRSGRRGRSRRSRSRSRASSGARSRGGRSATSADRRLTAGSGAASATVEQRLSGILKSVSRRGGNSSLGRALGGAGAAGTGPARSSSRHSARSSSARSRSSRSRSRSHSSRRGRFGRTAPAGSVRVSKRLTGETVASAARVLSTLVAPTSSPPTKASSRGGRAGGAQRSSQAAPRPARKGTRGKRMTKSAKL